MIYPLAIRVDGLSAGIVQSINTSYKCKECYPKTKNKKISRISAELVEGPAVCSHAGRFPWPPAPTLAKNITNKRWRIC
jgi:hypothetical protein